MRRTLEGAVLAITAILIQAHVGAKVLLGSLTDPDGPAHYVTGVMVYEFFRHPFASPALHFAKTFYVKFPKVAFGHWPPGLYLLEAAWFALWGPTILSARLLSAATAATIAVWIAVRLSRSYDWVVAVGCAAVFASAIPLQQAAWIVGSDLLTAGLMLMAMLSLADFLQQPGKRPALLFGLCCGAALLTKGSSWACGISALLAPLLCRQAGRYGNRWFYIGGVVACALGAPFYLIANHYAVAYPAGYAHLTSVTLPLASRWNAVPILIRFVPGVFGSIALLGFIDSLRLRWLAGDNSPAVTDEIVAGTWVIGQVLFLFALPLTAEGRVFLPSLAALVFPFARGLTTLQALAKHAGWISRVIPAALALVAIASGAMAPFTWVEGYREAARAIPFPQDGALMLVSSDGFGEGAWIAERLSMDPFQAGVILRASRLLAESDWGGNLYHLKVRDAGEVHGMLAEIPIRYVAVIRSNGIPPHPDEALLDQALRGDPERFTLIGSFPLRNNGTAINGQIKLFENRLATRHPAIVRVPLGLNRGGRMLEYRWP